MLLLRTLKTMKRRQLYWTVLCVLSLLESKVSGEASQTPTVVSLQTSNSSIQTTTTTTTTTTTAVAAAAAAATGTTTPLTTLGSTEKESINKSATVASKEVTTQISNFTSTNSPMPTRGNISSHPNVTDLSILASTSSHSPATILSTTINETTQAWTKTPATSSATSSPKQTSPSFATKTGGDASSMKENLECVNIKQVTNREVICLELNMTYTCEDFVKMKGTDLTALVCESQRSPQCHIELAEYDMNRHCILLVTVNNNKDVSSLNGILSEKTSALQKLGIKVHKQEGIRSHQDVSRKTLIALVTSGLLLAFLGLAGYFLMKRRSWSPMGERLGEDPYYTENGSHGNTMISVTSQEQTEPQEKPNLNGGAQESRTGQSASKNGHSTRPHVVADSEL
uniref:CD34 molecule n=1 Tax=Sphenodon punctatus TaxID=8508 RepID=A0A8D0HLF9_SPHPU